jgi:hypothetical protein
VERLTNISYKRTTKRRAFTSKLQEKEKMEAFSRNNYREGQSIVE